MTSKKTKTPNKIKTRDLILQKSTELFNDFGVESVSIYRVAETVGISTGNLTYYFKRKKDLIAALLNELDVQLVESVDKFPYISSARKFVQAYVETFSLSWRYRFLFNSAHYLIQNDLIDSGEYQQAITDVSLAFSKNIKELINKGFMAPIEKPYNVATLVDSIWWQWLGWLRINQMRPPKEHIALKDILKKGIRQTLFITHFYMNQDFVARVHKEIDQNFPKV